MLPTSTANAWFTEFCKRHQIAASGDVQRCIELAYEELTTAATERVAAERLRTDTWRAAAEAVANVGVLKIDRAQQAKTPPRVLGQHPNGVREALEVIAADTYHSEIIVRAPTHGTCPADAAAVDAAGDTSADIERQYANIWRGLAERALNVAGTLTNYVDDRPELMQAKNHLAELMAEFVQNCDGMTRRPHTDDFAVNRFAAAMREKMARARRKGRSGWDDKAQTSGQELSAMLRAHVDKGDPVDVANFAMMLHQRDEMIAPPPVNELLTALADAEEMTEPEDDLPTVDPVNLEQVLRAAFQFGSLYWQQVESESLIENNCAKETLSLFDSLKSDVLAAHRRAA